MTEDNRDRPRTLETIGAVVVGAPVAWTAFSWLAVNHRMPLPRAIEAERRTFSAPTVGILSYYVDEDPHGVASSRPLVLLHSINAAASSYEMRPLFEHYRRTRQVYALDLPGFGFSSRADRTYSPALYVASIIEFLQDLAPGTDGVDVIALSLTSEFAALAALERPELFHSLVLISPTGLDGSGRSVEVARPDDRGRRVRRLGASPLFAQALFDLLVTRPSIAYFLGRQFAGRTDPGLRSYSYATAHQPGARHAPMYFLSGSLFTSAIREIAYERLQLPVLVLHDESAHTTFDALPQLVSAHLNWRARRIGPAGDLVHFEQLSEATTAIDDFWHANGGMESSDGTEMAGHPGRPASEG